MMMLEEFAEPSIELVAPFMFTLEQARLQAAFDDWCEFTQKSPLLRKWRYFLALDPYTRWGLLKPRGYAGDATLMDFAYGHPVILDEVSQAGPLGEVIYRHTSGAAQSASARLRIQLIAQEIARRAVFGPLTVASYACGHARELEHLGVDVAQKLHLFVAVDADKQSLAEAQRSAGGVPFAGVCRNVLKHDLSDAPQVDLVYSLGLFDYLKDEHAALVTRKMLDQAHSGGTVLLANLAPSAANLAYCEAIMDWWMIPRTEADLMRLANEVLQPGEGRFDVEQHGCFNYLRIQK